MSEVSKRFEECKTLQDLMKTASTLKKDGYDILEVNKSFEIHKKRVLQRVHEVKRFKVAPICLESKELTSSLMLQVQNIASPVIAVNDTGGCRVYTI